MITMQYYNYYSTYGNNICEPFYAGGSCTDILSPFPDIITNLSRSVQTLAIGSVENIFYGLQIFNAPQHCILAATPLLCRYSFPTCDPAYRAPTYQPICLRDCEVVRDFLCREAWQAMLKILAVITLDYLDTPSCDSLENPEGGDAPMCINTVNKGTNTGGMLGAPCPFIALMWSMECILYPPV